MGALITGVGPRSPAQRKGIRAGETLLAINGHAISDVLDYKFHSYDARLELELAGEGGARRRVGVKKQEGADLGLMFETYLMDRARTCANKCVFCFIDQLPPGMRESLYFKDDDARLSFLMGNYITLTNLTEREIKRITDMRISPVNVSVHTTNPALRSMMLGNRRGGESLKIMDRFCEAGIVMNCQIVVCPGLNDGEELRATMERLSGMFPQVKSVSVVPVGLTRHRQGLFELRPFDGASAAQALDLVTEFSGACRERLGSRIFFCSDELYLLAGRPIPPDEHYEGYPQLENGVGMLRLTENEFLAALEERDSYSGTSFTIATGVSAAPFLEKLLCTAKAKYANIMGTAVAIENDFFGKSINVAGLVTGGDMIKQLSGKNLGERLLIPSSMLRSGEDVFLDDVTLGDVERALGIPVFPVHPGGYELAEAIFEKSGR